MGRSAAGEGGTAERDGRGGKVEARSEGAITSCRVPLSYKVTLPYPSRLEVFPDIARPGEAKGLYEYKGT